MTREDVELLVAAVCAKFYGGFRRHIRGVREVPFPFVVYISRRAGGEGDGGRNSRNGSEWIGTNWALEDRGITYRDRSLYLLRSYFCRAHRSPRLAGETGIRIGAYVHTYEDFTTEFSRARRHLLCTLRAVGHNVHRSLRILFAKTDPGLPKIYCPNLSIDTSMVFERFLLFFIFIFPSIRENPRPTDSDVDPRIRVRTR